MICPICKRGETSVVDSRPTEDGTTIRRRRLCGCGERFTTFERVQIRELMVVKKNGRKSSFDRDKLAKSIYIALKKRPIDTDTVEHPKVDARRSATVWGWFRYITDDFEPERLLASPKHRDFSHSKS